MAARKATKKRIRDGLEAVAEWEAEHGAFSERELVDAYLRVVPAKERALLVALRKTIHELVPEAEEHISYRMPAFRYRGAVIAGFQARKSGASYYPFSGRTLATLRDDLTRFDQTKSALHFDAPLSKSAVRKLLKARIAEVS